MTFDSLTAGTVTINGTNYQCDGIETGVHGNQFAVLTRIGRRGRPVKDFRFAKPGPDGGVNLGMWRRWP